MTIGTRVRLLPEFGGWATGKTAVVRSISEAGDRDRDGKGLRKPRALGGLVSVEFEDGSRGWYFPEEMEEIG